MKNSQRKRVLILTPRFPYPVIGGDRLRVYQVCKALSRRFSLTLLSLCETNEELDFVVPEDGVFDRVERILLTRFQSYCNTLIVAPTKIPMQVGYYRSKAFRKAVERLLPEHDAVVSHLIRCAEYVKDARKPKILEMTDAISLNYDRIKRQKNAVGFKSMIYRLEADRLLTYERLSIERFDLSVLVSETDRNFLLQGKHNDKVLVCSNGVDVHSMPYTERHTSSPVIVYIGNMTSVQNMDACLYFAQNVMPLISINLKATFRVVGKISESDAARLRTFPNVEVTGSVPDIAIAVADARVGVCPVRIGAGVQNKVLEYMALGLPTITSSIGLEGFEAIPGKDILVADTPDEYLRQLARIWNDRSSALELAKNGRRYVEDNHDWATRLNPMVERVYEILQKSGGI